MQGAVCSMPRPVQPPNVWAIPCVLRVQIIAKTGSHKFRYEQLEQAVETHFPVSRA